jgi:hypothetical protein
MDEGECYEHCEHARRAMDGMEPQTNKTTRPAGATRALAACRSVCVRGGGMHVVCTGTAAIALCGGDGIAATKPSGMPLQALAVPYAALSHGMAWDRSHGTASARYGCAARIVTFSVWQQLSQNGVLPSPRPCAVHALYYEYSLRSILCTTSEYSLASEWVRTHYEYRAQHSAPVRRAAAWDSVSNGRWDDRAHPLEWEYKRVPPSKWE